jgi:ABC-2 type transport system permease protein
MRDLIAAEALKLRTLLISRVVLAVAVVISALGGFFLGDAGEDVTPTAAVVVSGQPMWFLAVIVAVLSVAGEFHHRTIRTTVLQTPQRSRVIVVKAIVVAVYGSLIAVVGSAVSVMAAVVTLRLKHDVQVDWSFDVVTTVLGVAALGAAWAVLAAGAGALLRSSTVAIVAVLVWRLVLEGILPIVTRAPAIAKWLPGHAADAVLYDGGPTLLQPWAGALVFAAYTAIVVIAGSLAFVHRDPA